MEGWMDNSIRSENTTGSYVYLFAKSVLLNIESYLNFNNVLTAVGHITVNSASNLIFKS